jgi:hypothetical protein
MHHNNVAAELTAIGPLSKYSGPEDDVDQILNRITLLQFRPPGLEELVRRYGSGDVSGRVDDMPRGARPRRSKVKERKTR